jgi:phosphoribosylformylglycinamidine cyclo-ligase
LERTFNMGIGMIAVLAAGDAQRAMDVLGARGLRAWVAGTVRPRHAGETGDAEAKGGQGGAVCLVGSHDS